MEKLKKYLRGIAANITTLVTIAGGIWLFFTYQKYETAELLNYIITGIGLIAGTLLIEKLGKLRRIEEKVDKVAHELEQSKVFLNCRTSEFWHDAVKMGKAIFISGGSLHFIIEKSGEIETLLARGCVIEAVPVRPCSSASEDLFNSVIKEIGTLESFNSNIIQALDFLLNLSKAYPNQIIVRLNDQKPSLGLFAIYQNESPINIQANIFSEKVPYDRRLSIRLTDASGSNAFAFGYLCDQIRYMQERLPQLTEIQLDKIITDARKKL